jgi:hypothetical protein
MGAELKAHEETIRLIDQQIWIHSLHLRDDPGQLELDDRKLLVGRIEELQKTKKYLVTDQDSGK